ncbi:MAG TPA: histidine kinase [Trebonia sp.]|nr:histidine kinase [Trebonia sp.]
MFRLLSGRFPRGLAPGAGVAPVAVRPAPYTPLLIAIRLGVIAFAVIAVPLVSPHFFSGPRGVVSGIALGVAAVAWAAGLWALFAEGERRTGVFIVALAVLGASGGVLTGLWSAGPAIAIPCVVAASAGVWHQPEISLAVTAETIAAFLVAGLASGSEIGILVGYPFALIGLWALGITRYAFAIRAEQAERMLEQTRRARKAETEAAALAERTRIAREIHDVLAHSLAAVSVNLQAAEGLLAALPGDRPELAKALECIERAGVFTREGLTEVRRAVNALRDNASPLPEQLTALATDHQAAGDTTVALTVSGAPRPVAPEASLTAYRTAQEALTNARKHAPGQPVRLLLEFAPGEIAVEVANPLPVSAPSGIAPSGGAADGDRSLAATGGGHGLTGLRERAALAGGTLTAGPADGQWQVCLRIPA